MSYNKFKDALPEDTVTHIKKIYKDLDLSLKYNLEEKVGGIFSATITDTVNGWTTCGKGTTAAYCQASAFGESMEHLCSYFAYDTHSLSDDANQYLGFLRYPDEEMVSLKEIPVLAPDVYRDMVDAYCRLGKQSPSTTDVISVWEKFLGTTNTTIVPYYSVRHQKIVYLPDIIIANLCGSNGGGAGNTPAEAIGHALDEISERYVKFQIYNKRLTPPIISRNYIREICPELDDLISQIEKKENFKIIVKDASMGRGLTVVSVLLVDQEKQRYLANFGAHPRFEIALERCLTEMFQLYSPEKQGMKRKGMAKWRNLSDDDFDGIRNWVSLLRDDTGVIPDSFFAGKPSWRFVPWKQYVEYNNRMGVKEQLHNILNITNADIYIRNVSFLGFPVYRIYVPGISTTYLSLDEQQLSAFEIGNELVSRIKQNINENPTQNELIQLRDSVFNPNSFISSLIFRSMSESMQNAFQASLFYDLGDKATAISILSKQDDRYCQCVIRDFELAEKGIDINTRNELLLLFYGKEETDFVACWQTTNVFLNLLRKYVIEKSFNLHGNASKDLSKTSSLHERIKLMMTKNIPDQMEIATLTNWQAV